MKNLGIIVQNNLKWNSNTANLCKKAYKNLWVIRRMKNLGLSTETLLEYYKKEIRVHLELAVPVWHSGLTIKLSADIERVQRIAVGIMLGSIPYTHACELLGLEPLSTRRIGLCKRFAFKTSRNSRHSDLFQLKSGQQNLRKSKKQYREHICRKSRFYKSPLPFLTRLLNK